MYGNFHSTTVDCIHRGLFPLEHDIILKVCSSVGFQYFTCSERFASRICVTFLKLLCVTAIEISSVDTFGDPYSSLVVTRDSLVKLSKRFHKSE